MGSDAAAFPGLYAALQRARVWRAVAGCNAARFFDAGYNGIYAGGGCGVDVEWGENRTVHCEDCWQFNVRVIEVFWCSSNGICEFCCYRGLLSDEYDHSVRLRMGISTSENGEKSTHYHRPPPLLSS